MVVKYTAEQFGGDHTIASAFVHRQKNAVHKKSVV